MTAAAALRSAAAQPCRLYVVRSTITPGAHRSSPVLPGVRMRARAPLRPGQAKRSQECRAYGRLFCVLRSHVARGHYGEGFAKREFTTGEFRNARVHFWGIFAKRDFTTGEFSQSASSLRGNFRKARLHYGGIFAKRDFNTGKFATREFTAGKISQSATSLRGKIRKARLHQGGISQSATSPRGTFAKRATSLRGNFAKRVFTMQNASKC